MRSTLSGLAERAAKTRHGRPAAPAAQARPWPKLPADAQKSGARWPSCHQLVHQPAGAARFERTDRVQGLDLAGERPAARRPVRHLEQRAVLEERIDPLMGAGNRLEAWAERCERVGHGWWSLSLAETGLEAHPAAATGSVADEVAGVAAGVLLEVVLMFFLRQGEGPGRGDLGGQRPLPEAAGLHLGLDLFGGLALLGEV